LSLSFDVKLVFFLFFFFFLLILGLSPDLYAIGFQEFDLSREAYLAIDEEKVRSWDQAILTALEKVGKYVQVSLLLLFFFLSFSFFIL
jgi:hypothetical protein